MTYQIGMLIHPEMYPDMLLRLFWFWDEKLLDIQLDIVELMRVPSGACNESGAQQ